MTGICQRRSLLQVMLGQDKGLCIVRRAAERICKLKQLQSSMATMRKEVYEGIANRRQRSMDAHNPGTNIVIPKFFVDDLVIVCKAKLPAHKLSFTWCGPCRVAAVTSPVVCIVQDLITLKSVNIHAARLKRYCNNLDGTEIPTDLLNLAGHTTAKYEVVAKLMDIHKSVEKLWLR